MARCIDLVGQRFGRLTVEARSGHNKHKQVLWKCVCDCGTILEVRGDSLRTGHTTSCGCYCKEQVSKANRHNLLGQKWGRLTVLEEVGRDKYSHVRWLCVCDCGKHTTISTQDFGHTVSCGCYNRERVSQARYQNLIGKVFGRLTVLEDVGRRHGGVLWRCHCNCGNIVDIRAGDLLSGGTKSCGCYRNELLVAMRAQRLSQAKLLAASNA